MTATATTPQRFARVFSVACDRPCTATLGGSVKVAGRRRALRVVATVSVTVGDARGQRATATRRVRLR